ncbi:MAG TPA: hypothetical protein VD788_07080, partial [Candidatus Polarisedimenticolaceae bacterium]|nr:hypothetical protein [Candidatus Polarisedimenticolaceae bacterium]
AVSGTSALIHVMLSVLLGLAALAVGVTTAELMGQTLERAASVLLVVFGSVYVWWAWRKGGHFHPGGRRLHGSHEREECDGREGDGNPEHLHYHADTALIADRGAWWLAFVIGVNPCVLILPVIFASARGGPAAVAAVCAAYAVPTALLMVGLSAAGVAGGEKLSLPLAARYAEVASGLVIAGLGVFLLVAHGSH